MCVFGIVWVVLVDRPVHSMQFNEVIMHLMRDNLKGSTIDNKKNELIILIRKKDIELPIAAKTW